MVVGTGLFVHRTSATGEGEFNDLCLFSAATVNRLDNVLPRLLHSWPGKLSFAVYGDFAKLPAMLSNLHEKHGSPSRLTFVGESSAAPRPRGASKNSSETLARTEPKAAQRAASLL